MKKFLVVLLVIGIAAAGGAYYALNTTKSVDVQWTEKDYQSYLQKVGAAPAGSNAVKTSKPFPVNTAFTSAEISAMLSKENEKTNGPVKDVKVRFLPNNELEASFVTTEKMKKYIPQGELAKYKIAENMIAGRPVYAKMKIEKASPKTIKLSLQDAAVGRVSVTQDQMKQAEGAITSIVNSRLQKLNNFSMNDLKIGDNSAQLNGNLQSAPRKLD